MWHPLAPAAQPAELPRPFLHRPLEPRPQPHHLDAGKTTKLGVQWRRRRSAAALSRPYPAPARGAAGGRWSEQGNAGKFCPGQRLENFRFPISADSLRYGHLGSPCTVPHKLGTVRGERAAIVRRHSREEAGRGRGRGRGSHVAGSSASASAAPAAPDPAAPARSRRLSDAIWPGLGAFLVFYGMAVVDRALAAHRLSISLASYAAVCCLLFALPQAPASQRRRVLFSHFLAALVGVGVMAVLGPTPLARCVAVSLAISAMILTDSMHPPAAGLPVIFIDAAKFHHLGFWYPIFPALAGCLWVIALQELILFLKETVQF